MRTRAASVWIPLAAAAVVLIAVLVRLGPEAPAPHPPRAARPATPAPPAPGPAPRARLARLALVIDDVGYEIDPVRELLALGAPLSFAVIPYQRHSRAAARLAHLQGQEVLVHLPMEPREYPRFDPGQGALLSSMDAEEIQHTLREAIAAVPYARGCNNHMGSRLTADPRAMRLVMEELSRQGLYFLDSRTDPGSVALRQARAASVRCLKRDVFLDARREERSIAEQLERAARTARQRGTAVVIAHPHPETLEVLRRQLPRLREEGVELVFASELAS